MDKNKFTVTVGIPAYNEEKNISLLIGGLLSQKLSEAVIKKIIVVSDGSSDKTVEIVRNIDSSLVKLIEGHEKIGKAFRQNHIIKDTNTDILVLLDADTRIDDPIFIQKLIRPIIENTAEMTSSSLTELKPRTYFESILFLSMQLKSILFSQINFGNNVYNCHGPARAFSRILYKKIRFEKNEGEDMYSYLFCKLSGYRFKFVYEAKIKYRLPSNIDDHIKQSVRFSYATDTISHLLENGMKKELTIPLRAVIVGGIKSTPLIVKNPMKVFLYLTILLYSKIKFNMSQSFEDMWQVTSSKIL